jgi:hypothetical protein
MRVKIMKDSNEVCRPKSQVRLAVQRICAVKRSIGASCLGVVLGVAPYTALSAPNLEPTPATVRLGSVAQCLSDRESAYPDLPGFSEDTGFDVQVRKGAGGLDIRVSGDYVIVDEETLGSLIAVPAHPTTRIHSLVFDARILVLRAPISLEGGSLTLLTDDLRIQGNGGVTLLPSGADTPNHFDITASHLHFTNSRKRPFDIALSDTHKVQIAAAIGDMGGDTATTADFWARFTDSLDAAAPWQNGVLIGTAASGAIQHAFLEQMAWPLYSAAKLRKHFSRAPFDPTIRQELRSVGTALLPKLADWRDPQPYATVAGVLAAMKNDTDLDGHSAAFTPKQDLESQRSDLEAAIGKDPFGRLTNIIVDTTSDAAARAEQLTATRNALGKTNGELGKLSDALDEITRNLAVASQQGAVLDGQIRVRQDELKRMAEEEREAQENANKIKQFSAIGAAAVVTIATAGGATPLVAAAAGTGAALIGDSIYRNNTGKSTTLLEIVKSGEEAYTAASAFEKSWRDFKNERDIVNRVYGGEVVREGPPPQDGQPDQRQQLTKVDATMRLLGSAATTVDRATAIGGVQAAVPRQLELSELEDGDERLRTLLGQRTAVMDRIGLLTADANSKSKELEGLTTRRVELTSLDEQMRAAAPANDQENARWRADALALWGMNVQHLSDLVLQYRKSLFFETGRVPLGVGSVLDYPNELVSQLALGTFDALAGEDPSAPKNVIRERLDSQRDRFMQSIEASKESIDRTFKEYLSERAQANVIRRSTTFSTGGSAVERAFLVALNTQIRQQIVTKMDSADVFPMPVPYEFPKSLNRDPERIINVRVVRATFDVPNTRIGPNAIEFDIIHPQYGEMRRDNRCYVADLRTSATDWRWFPTPLEMVNPDWTHETPQPIHISTQDRGDFYAYLPARAPYAMVVNIYPKEWKQIPKLLSIEIGFEVMQ